MQGHQGYPETLAQTRSPTECTSGSVSVSWTTFGWNQCRKEFKTNQHLAFIISSSSQLNNILQFQKVVSNSTLQQPLGRYYVNSNLQSSQLN